MGQSNQGAMAGMTGSPATGGKMSGGASETERVPFDFYPTPPEPTHALLDFCEAHHLLPTGHDVWEPACGDGAMAEVLDQRGYQVMASDIRDTGYGTVQDFLTTEPIAGDLSIITNPPFVRAVEFITHALRFRPTMLALLLKATYWHSQKRARWFHQSQPDGGPFRPDYVLPIGWRVAFQPERGNSPPMDVAWYVWTPDTPLDRCAYHPLPKPSPQEELL
ncbi:MAG: hypothetical protein Alpg2KO_01180 [Alphaproteobacteria bacterium]